MTWQPEVGEIQSMTKKPPKTKPATVAVPTPVPARVGSTIYWNPEILRAAKHAGVDLGMPLSAIVEEAVVAWLAARGVWRS